MTQIAWVMFATAIAAGAVDWIAVAHANLRLRWVSKPATVLLLVVVAIALHPASNQQQLLFIAALLLCLAGDIALLKQDHWFRAGLAAFLVGHLTYAAGFLVGGGLDRGRLAYSAVGVALVSLGVGGRIMRSILGSDRRSMALAVAGYLLAISAMVALAVASGKPAAIAGAALFYASDGMIAWNRFVRPVPWSPLPVIVTYHLAQAGLVLSLAQRGA